MEIRFKKIKIFIIFCLVTLSFYKILINELFITENIFFKINKIIVITIGLMVITLIIYGLYLQRLFENKYKNSKRICLGNRHWKLTTIIIVYFLILLYYIGMPFQIWYLIFIIPYTSILLFGFKRNYVLLDYNSKLYFVTKDYAINVVKNISYDKTYDVLSLEIINELNIIDKVTINKIRNKKIFKDIYSLLEKYNASI